MRIGIDIRELRRGTSTGIGRYVRSFLRYARERLASHDFTLFADEATDASGFDWARTRVLNAPWPFYDHFLLPQALRADGVELFFSPYYKAPRFCHCPYVVTIHDLMFLYVDDGARLRSVKNRLIVAASRGAAERAAGVITVSDYSKADIERVLGLVPDKIAVIPNSVPQGFEPADVAVRAETLRAHRLAAGFVLYVGSFKASKNPGALVEAFAALAPELRRRHPLILLGPQDAEYRAFRARWGAAAEKAGARFLSGLRDLEIAALYSDCGLCVVPSIYEGFGMPALEAMACGAPVLASNKTSLPEVVGDAAELCEPDAAGLGAAMTRLLPDDARLQELRRRGLERAKDYSYLSVGEKIFSVLRRCAR